ncbi:hypothetical protein KDA_65290 [Dictyobacter alpinus]|uniref:Uncharacterized protein n=1 Tax=Dictyobacter alpinus TaxID=2014873 RepID=A0A402BI59_9CHLR|nr:hypothetical protein KDA_65290 [Dictyobacter alpinus]
MWGADRTPSGRCGEPIVRRVGAARKAALLGLRGPTRMNETQCCGAYTNHGGWYGIDEERLKSHVCSLVGEVREP